MDRIDAMRAFMAAVDRGSLAAAARRLECSAAKVTRGIAMLEGRLGMRLLHRSTRALHLTDFGETAAVVENLDLIITVDTSMGHLAGALGKPAWILIPKAADWRWMLEREDSPWYPSVRLFRQPKPGTWDEPLDRLRAALRRELAGSRAEGFAAN